MGHNILKARNCRVVGWRKMEAWLFFEACFSRWGNANDLVPATQDSSGFVQELQRPKSEFVCFFEQMKTKMGESNPDSS
jgi:hypothetical protein